MAPWIRIRIRNETKIRNTGTKNVSQACLNDAGLSGECIEEQGHHWVGLDIAPAMLQVPYHLSLGFLVFLRADF